MCINPSVQFQKVTFPFVRTLVFSVQVTEKKKKKKTQMHFVVSGETLRHPLCVGKPGNAICFS